MIFNETKQHGKADFPFETYYIDKSHPRYEMAFHWHSSLEIIKVLSGTLNITLNNKNFIAKKGDVYFVNSEVIHGATPNNCVYECLVFNPAFIKNGNHGFDSFIDGLINQRTFIHTKIKDEEVIKIIDELFLSMQAQKEGYQFSVIGNLCLLFYKIIEKKLFASDFADFLEKEQSVIKLKRVLKYIRENFALDITLSDMSAVAGFSTKYFCHYFKSLTGKTPVDYLRSFRIEQAARKLIETDEPITDIAFSCGFNDFSYFIKTFKSIKKTTPKKYRSGI